MGMRLLGAWTGKLDTSISIIMNILMRAFAANSNMLHVTEGEHWRGVGGYINLVRSGTTLPFYIPLLHRITKNIAKDFDGCVLSSLKTTQVRRMEFVSSSPLPKFSSKSVFLWAYGFLCFSQKYRY
jgi:hypothetical protein